MPFCACVVESGTYHGCRRRPPECLNTYFYYHSHLCLVHIALRLPSALYHLYQTQSIPDDDAPWTSLPFKRGRLCSESWIGIDRMLSTHICNFQAW